MDSTTRQTSDEILIDSQICRFHLKVTYVVEQLTPQQMNDLKPASFDIDISATL